MDDDQSPQEPRAPNEGQQPGQQPVEMPPTPSGAAPQPEAHERVEQGAPPELQPQSRAGAEAPPGTGPAGQAGAQPGAGAAAGAPPGSREPGPRVEIGIAEGDLRVVGGAVHVTLRQPRHADAANAPQDRGGTLYFARVANGTELQVPDGVELELREVRGDLTVQSVDGRIEVGHAGGDVTLDGITAAHLVRVRGDLRAANGGDVQLREVGGDADITGVARLALDGRVRSDLTLQEIAQVDLRGAVGGDLEAERCGAVTLQGSVGGDLTVAQCAGALSVGTVSGDATLTQVRSATFTTVGGDLDLRRCLGAVRGASVGGDATVTEVESLALTSVGGDLTAGRIGRGVEVRAVSGDAKLSRIGGRIAASVVGGDLDVEEAPSGVSVEKVGGDANLDSELGAGAQYSVFAGGDVTLRVRGEVNARFVAQAGGEVSTNLPLSVERGRRRNLVGVLGRGEATVTLRSGGDIRIVAADRHARRATMSDEREGQGPNDEMNESSDAGGTSAGARMWEGSFGGKRFRLRWEQGPGHAGMHFQGPIDADDPDAVGGPHNRAFGVEWDRGRGARTYGEYEERLRELGDKAERVARKAAEQAQDLAEEAARKTRETDWEAVGREVRGAISKAMSELEDAFTRVRSEWERPSGPSGGAPSGGQGARGGSTAQRVRIEQDEEQPPSGAGPSSTSQSSSSSQTNSSSQTSGGTGSSSNYSSTTQYSTPSGYSSSSSYYGSGTSGESASGQPSTEDRETQRRQILEQLRSGQISLDEAERKLNELR